MENSLQLAEAYSMMDDYENAVSVLQKADQNDASIKNALLEARVATDSTATMKERTIRRSRL